MSGALMNMKVFELAKELNLGAVELIDKLRENGINVRNHMVTLTDDEVVAAKKIFVPSVSSKTAVKKVVKKKSMVAESGDSKEVLIKSAGIRGAAAKVDVANVKMASLSTAAPLDEVKVAKKAKSSSVTELQADDSTNESMAGSKKTLTIKRKTKNLDEMNSDQEDSLHSHLPSTDFDSSHLISNEDELNKDLERDEVISAQNESKGDDKLDDVSVAKTSLKQKSLYQEDMPKGLAIVSKPVEQESQKKLAVEDQQPTSEAKAPSVETVQAPKVNTKLRTEKERAERTLYKEKMHTFTPVFIPEVSAKSLEEKKAKEALDGLVAKKPRTDLEIQEDFDGDEKASSKKRIGDLAAIVSKKVEKKDITVLRAEEELKYVEELLGHSVYTPPKRKRVWNGASQKTLITSVKDSKRVVYVHGSNTALDLAQKLSVRFDSLANKALELNLLLAPEDELGVSLSSDLAALYNYRVEDRSFDENEILLKNNEPEKDKVKSTIPLRSPIVTIMGHVDHGKTTLLDTIRQVKVKVAAGEAGGITQHIGAYTVKVNDKQITFLDTPGHAAFASMRQRGADVTDIVILVVAADDGVMPQTVESIKFIQNAKVPLVVAINKMDKTEAKPDRIKQELMQYGITPEEWGGDVQFVEVSALKMTGIDKLLESILIQAEVMELRAETKGKAEAIVIESKLETGRGPVCTVIIKSGTLKKGDAIVAGETYGRARNLLDHVGAILSEAGPSMPVQLIGLESTPSPGDTFFVVESEREAKKIVENRINDRKALELAEKKKLNLEDFFSTSDGDVGGKKILNLIVRTDVLGSFEAIKNSVEYLGNAEVGVKVIGGGAGAISDNDVMLASSTKGYILGFNMRPVTSARKLAEDKGVDVKTYTIIYELLDEVKLALEGMLTPTKIEKYIGRAQVKETFSVPKAGTIAGSFVIDGKIEKGCNIRLLRDGKIIHDGKLSSLKRFKDDAKEVKNGLECGIGLDNFNEIKVNDIFEAYMIEEKKRTLDATTV